MQTDHQLHPNSYSAPQNVAWLTTQQAQPAIGGHISLLETSSPVGGGGGGGWQQSVALSNSIHQATYSPPPPLRGATQYGHQLQQVSPIQHPLASRQQQYQMTSPHLQQRHQHQLTLATNGPQRPLSQSMSPIGVGQTIAMGAAEPASVALRVPSINALAHPALGTAPQVVAATSGPSGNPTSVPSITTNAQLVRSNRCVYIDENGAILSPQAVTVAVSSPAPVATVPTAPIESVPTSSPSPAGAQRRQFGGALGNKSDPEYLEMRPSGSLSQDWLDKICRQLVEHMNHFGICVIDNFLGSLKADSILKEVQRLYSSGHYTKGRLVAANKLEPAKQRPSSPTETSPGQSASLSSAAPQTATPNDSSPSPASSADTSGGSATGASTVSATPAPSTVAVGEPAAYLTGGTTGPLESRVARRRAERSFHCKAY